MKNPLLLLLTLVATSTALLGQTPPADSTSTPTYTYYPLFSKEWIGNENFAAAVMFPITMEITQAGSQDMQADGNSLKSMLNFDSSTPTTRKEDAKFSLRAELLEFLIAADRVALNINGTGNGGDNQAATALIASLHQLTSCAQLQSQLSLNWDDATISYSASPSRHELQKIYTLLGQCEEDQLATLVAAAQFTTDESTQYNAFRALQSTIDPNNSITLAQFRLASLEYINVLLARRVSVANGTTATDGFDALNQTLLSLNLNAPDNNMFGNAAAVDCWTLSNDAEDAMLQYEMEAAPAIEWNL